MFTEKPPSEWSETLTDIDMPTDYFMSFAALLSTVGALVLPFWMVDAVVGPLAPIAITNKEDADFFVNKYLPALYESSAKVVLSDEDSKSIQHKFEGMLIKIVYAFLW